MKLVPLLLAGAVAVAPVSFAADAPRPFEPANEPVTTPAGGNPTPFTIAIGAAGALITLAVIASAADDDDAAPQPATPATPATPR